MNLKKDKQINAYPNFFGEAGIRSAMPTDKMFESLNPRFNEFKKG